MSKELKQEERYIKRIKLRIGLSVLFILCGIIAVVAGNYLEANNAVGSTMSGFYIGTGGGLVGAGVVTWIKNWMLLKDDAKRKAAYLEEYDERNLFLRERTMTYSGYILVGILYLGCIVLGMVNETVAMTLLSILGLYLFLIFIINILLRKKG